ncbi:MAG: hypothetical protein NW223_23160 [Hyphomicrobiaceae bacterium]|nr:hypothetical protein [Hyphomicrobiaceae bacterium]
MQTDDNQDRDPFISDTYRGHQIATLQHGGAWLVYLDHILQNRLKFATAEAAITWLQRQVEKMSPDLETSGR